MSDAVLHCAKCHKLPPPDVLPKRCWRDEIARMFLIQQNQPEPIGPPGTAARMVTLPRTGNRSSPTTKRTRRNVGRAGHVACRRIKQCRSGNASLSAVGASRRTGGGEHPAGRSGSRRTARDGVERHAQRHRLQGQTVRRAAGVRGDQHGSRIQRTSSPSISMVTAFSTSWSATLAVFRRLTTTAARWCGSAGAKTGPTRRQRSRAGRASRTSKRRTSTGTAASTWQWRRSAGAGPATSRS